MIVFLFSFGSAYILTRVLIPLLQRSGSLAEDFHKAGKPKVPWPGGPAIVAAIALGEYLLFLTTGDNRALTIMLVSVIAGAIGLLDDFTRLGGKVKPTLLILASLPILLLGTYDFHLAFPFFGTVRLSLIYPILVLAAIPVTANTVNALDVLNGLVSAFLAIATVPLIIALILKSNYLVSIATLPLLGSSLAFFIFHRYPSKIFPGDSGTLALGAVYGAIAIVGRVEFVGVIAILPAILNSFFFLSSVKNLVEHRKLRERPVVLTDDYKLSSSASGSAPMTLVRMIVAFGPLREREVVNEVLKLTSYSAILAVLTAFTI